MIIYRLADLQDIELLVDLRIQDMKLFYTEPFPKEHIGAIKKFYTSKMKENTCFTILGYDKDCLVTMGAIYFYDVLPSNTNPLGIMGYITNVWTHEKYRHQGLAGTIVDQLLAIAKKHHSPVSLTASEEGVHLYLKKGFVKNKSMMVYISD
jgi:predicted GNAT family N-acyltransferase